MAGVSRSKQISTIEQITAIVVAIGVAFLIICFGRVSSHYERFVIQAGAALGAFMVIFLWQIITGRKKKPPS
jgi:uncharacterized membrane protein YozB (DUF420 family)